MDNSIGAFSEMDATIEERMEFGSTINGVDEIYLINTI
ncbi:Hypothetical protein Tcol_2369 [Trichococcus collinsii]|nr:Hypothetical protein Tcol_2369 [Trichococcus collinsii]